MAVLLSLFFRLVFVPSEPTRFRICLLRGGVGVVGLWVGGRCLLHAYHSRAHDSGSSCSKVGLVCVVGGLVAERRFVVACIPCGSHGSGVTRETGWFWVRCGALLVPSFPSSFVPQFNFFILVASLPPFNNTGPGGLVDIVGIGSGFPLFFFPQFSISFCSSIVSFILFGRFSFSGLTTRDRGLPEIARIGLAREMDGYIGGGDVHRLRGETPGHRAHPGGQDDDAELDREHRGPERG